MEARKISGIIVVVELVVILFILSTVQGPEARYVATESITTNNSFAELIVYKPNQTPSWGLKPGVNASFDGYAVEIEPVRVVTNSQGFRDDNFTKEKRPDEFRILTIGDSFTFGWGVDEDESYVARIEKRLNRSSSRDVNVLNMGIPGYNPYHHYSLLNSTGVKYNPDLVMIGFTESEDLVPVYANETHQELLDEYRRELEAQGLKAEKIKILVNKRRGKLRWKEFRDEGLEKSWARVGKWHRRIDTISEREGFEVVVFFHSATSPEQKKLWLERTEELGWVFVDTGMTHEAFKRRYKLALGDWHINSAGHKKIAKPVARAIIGGELIPE